VRIAVNGAEKLVHGHEKVTFNERAFGKPSVLNTRQPCAVAGTLLESFMIIFTENLKSMDIICIYLCRLS
jgi:hypothetical protein